MKRKARDTFAEAQVLANATPSRWSGSANRAYYSLYQAIVGELEQQGHTPDKFGHVDPKHPERWQHAIILLNAGLAGLDRTQKKVLESAYGMRIKADYRPDPVEKADVEGILVRIPALLGTLGC